MLRHGDGRAEDGSMVDWWTGGRDGEVAGSGQELDASLLPHVPISRWLPSPRLSSVSPQTHLGLPDLEGIPMHIHSADSFYKKIYFYVYFCLHGCLCAVCAPGVLRGQESVSDTLRLEL